MRAKRIAREHDAMTNVKHTKEVMSNSPGLLDFVVGYWIQFFSDQMGKSGGGGRGG